MNDRNSPKSMWLLDTDVQGIIDVLTNPLSVGFVTSIRFNTVLPSLINTNLASKLLNSTKKINLHTKNLLLKKVGKAKDMAGAYLLRRVN